MLHFQAAREHPRVGERVGPGVPAAVLRCPGSFGPFCRSPFPSPSRSSYLPGGYFQKQRAPGWHQSRGGRPDLSCLLPFWRTIHLFLSPKALTDSERMKGRDTFVNKILQRKIEPSFPEKASSHILFASAVGSSLGKDLYTLVSRRRVGHHCRSVPCAGLLTLFYWQPLT